MKITEEFFRSWMTDAGGYTRAQLNLLNVEWPPSRGWKTQLIGIEISGELYQKVMEAKHITSGKHNK